MDNLLLQIRAKRYNLHNFFGLSQRNEKNSENSLKMSPEVQSKVISDAIAKHSGIIVEPNQEEEFKISRKKK